MTTFLSEIPFSCLPQHSIHMPVSTNAILASRIPILDDIGCALFSQTMSCFLTETRFPDPWQIFWREIWFSSSPQHSIHLPVSTNTILASRFPILDDIGGHSSLKQCAAFWLRQGFLTHDNFFKVNYHLAVCHSIQYTCQLLQIPFWRQEFQF